MEALDTAAHQPHKKRIRKKDKRPDEIISTALNLFVKNGYHKTSLADIAKAAGIARSTIYLYFDDKSDLLRKAIEQIFTDNRDEFLNEVEFFSLSKKELLQKVVAFITKIYNDDSKVGFYSLIHTLAISDSEVAAIWRHEVIDKIKMLWRQVGAANGIDQDEADFYSSLHFSLFFSYLVTRRCFKEDNPFMDFNELLLRLFEKIS